MNCPKLPFGGTSPQLSCELELGQPHPHPSLPAKRKNKSGGENWAFQGLHASTILRFISRSSESRALYKERVSLALDINNLEPWALEAVADAALERAAAQLRDVLKDLANRLDPFPAFFNMTTLQAVEVEPEGLTLTRQGCIVVCADGELYELSLQAIQGPLDLTEADQVEEFRALTLAPAQYVLYARAAIKALMEHTRTG